MSDTYKFDQDDFALLAMQFLPPEEEAQIRVLLHTSPDLQSQMAEVQGDLAIYAMTVDMHTPPAMARERLLTQIGRERKIQSIDRAHESVTRSAAYGAGPGTDMVEDKHDRPSRTGRIGGMRDLEDDDQEAHRQSSGLGRILPWLGWAVAAGIAVTTGNFYHESETLRGNMAHDRTELSKLTADAAAARKLMETLEDPSATRVTLTRGKSAPEPQGKVTYVADRGALLFVASNLEPLDTYKVYELWLIPANGQAPVAAGTFHPDARGNASVVLPNLPTGLTAKAFGITVEDEGGSQTPTMPILLSGAAAGA